MGLRDLAVLAAVLLVIGLAIRDWRNGRGPRGGGSAA